MDKVFVVARREFLTTVRTRAFILSVLLMPTLVVGAIFGTQAAQSLAQREQIPVRRLAVLDRTGVVFAELNGQVEAYNALRPNQRFELESLPVDETDLGEVRARVQAGELYGFATISADALDGDSPCKLARSDNQLETRQQLGRMINHAVQTVRFNQAGLEPARVEHLRREVPIVELNVSTGEAVKTNLLARTLTPFAFMFLLFISTFGISQWLLTSLIEEKSSRVVELLLSAVSPAQLMAGKILGTAMVGFLLIGVWGTVGFASGRAYNLTDLVTGQRLVLVVLYFVPGFLLIASILAAIGSACNELRDAQSMVFPLSILTVFPMIFWFYIAEYPTSMLSMVLSYVAPITPFIMILRVCADPDTPVWQIVSTLAVLWASVVLAIWAAGKIFRVGVLMYGKPPSPRELLRWVRQA